MTNRTASCSCGQLRADVTSDPIRVSVCHCLACQRRTGSVFGAQARFAAQSVTITGEAREYVRAGDEGSRITFRFCPACGATVYYTLERVEDAIAIPVGAFADPGFPSPAFSIYEDRMHAWVAMPPGVTRIA